MPRPRISPALINVLLALCLVVSGLAATVHFNYQGKLTGLFCIGSRARISPHVASLDPYRFSDSYGYDGQYFLMAAIDPLIRSDESSKSMDNPSLRYRRILVPALAHALALGRVDWIPLAFAAIVVGFILLGVYWSTGLAMALDFRPFCGLFFLLIPATLISLDRMLVDAAASAVAVGLLRYCAPLRPTTFLLLACAPLIRETGVVFPLAAALSEVLEKRWRAAAIAALCLLPALAWYVYVALHTPSAPFGDLIPFRSLLAGFSHLTDYPATVRFLPLIRTLDLLALAGGAALVLKSLYDVWGRKLSFPVIAAGLLALMTVTLPVPDFWSEVYAFGRVLSPLLVIFALDETQPAVWRFGPWFLMLLRTAFQLIPQAKAVAVGLIR